ncbi:MAG: RND transporter [Gammaproteobacteria bacterium]|nr:RND transporter [Gammaproteobacteria bacterium]MDH5801081.1 RND transporter [Gammaproteobacteria bacterium]
MRWLDKIPLLPLTIAAVLLGLAPLKPQPHLWEKLQFLIQGTLTKPIDIFDLCLHGSLLVLLFLKLLRLFQNKRG